MLLIAHCAEQEHTRFMLSRRLSLRAHSALLVNILLAQEYKLIYAKIVALDLGPSMEQKAVITAMLGKL